VTCHSGQALSVVAKAVLANAVTTMSLQVEVTALVP
jgi:hypothetical protein